MLQRVWTEATVASPISLKLRWTCHTLKHFLHTWCHHLMDYQIRQLPTFLTIFHLLNPKSPRQCSLLLGVVAVRDHQVCILIVIKFRTVWLKKTSLSSKMLTDASDSFTNLETMNLQKMGPILSTYFFRQVHRLFQVIYNQQPWHKCHQQA